MNSIDEIMENPETRLIACRLVRQGYVMIQEKYGLILDWMKRQPEMTSEVANNEISRRDYLLYRYVRLYSNIEANKKREEKNDRINRI